MGKAKVLFEKLEEKEAAYLAKLLVVTIFKDIGDKARLFSTYGHKIPYGRQRQKLIKSIPSDYSKYDNKYHKLLTNILLMIPMDTLARITDEIDSFLEAYYKKEARTNEQ